MYECVCVCKRCLGGWGFAFHSDYLLSRGGFFQFALRSSGSLSIKIGCLMLTFATHKHATLDRVLHSEIQQHTHTAYEIRERHHHQQHGERLALEREGLAECRGVVNKLLKRVCTRGFSSLQPSALFHPFPLPVAKPVHCNLFAPKSCYLVHNMHLSCTSF